MGEANLQYWEMLGGKRGGLSEADPIRQKKEEEYQKQERDWEVFVKQQQALVGLEGNDLIGRNNPFQKTEVHVQSTISTV